MPHVPLDFLVSALVTLLVVVDPIGLVPSFIAVTDALPESARRQVAVRASVTGGSILAGTLLIGEWLLSSLGITLAAFRIAGGLLLFSIASEMVLGVRTERQARTAEQALDERVRNVATFPLAIPLMAGPGAITATVLLAGQAHRAPLTLVALLGVIVLVCLATLASFLIAARIMRRLGTTGNLVISRLLGVVLAALAVQFVVDGIRTALSPGG